MADPLESKAASQATDAVVGGEACGLVDHHKAEGTHHRQMHKSEMTVAVQVAR